MSRSAVWPSADQLETLSSVRDQVASVAATTLVVFVVLILLCAGLIPNVWAEPPASVGEASTEIGPGTDEPPVAVFLASATGAPLMRSDPPWSRIERSWGRPSMPAWFDQVVRIPREAGGAPAMTVTCGNCDYGGGDRLAFRMGHCVRDQGGDSINKKPGFGMVERSERNRHAVPVSDSPRVA